MLGWLRLDVVKLVLLAVPVLAFKKLLLGVDLDAEGAGVALALLAAGAAVVLWRRHGRPTALGNGFLVFFLVYCLVFSVAASSDLLTGPRRLLAGYESVTPRNFLALNPLGDWHYAWARPAPPAHDLVVVTLPSFAGEHREDVRRRFTFMIRKALEHGARGIAFDYFLKEPSLADAFLAAEIGKAAERGLPVIFGYLHVEKDGWIVRQPIAPAFAEVLPLERLGHLAGYLEYDDRVRMVPVDLPGVGGLPSFSFRIAEVLAGGDVAVPSSALVQFTAPAGGLRVQAFSPELDFELWRDRFIVVGTSSPTDARRTPFGELQGVEIHAYAAHALRAGCFLRRLHPDWTFPANFALCYVLIVLEVRGLPWRKLLLAALGLSAGVVATAALAMRAVWLWIDVSYPLAAIWGLAVLLLAGRWLRRLWRARRRERPVELPAAPAPLPAGDGFDVFLSHNGRDKPVVRTISDAVAIRGLRPWLDEQQLVPGRPWQEALEEIIRTVRSSAVLVGQDGLGPWEVPEMRASLSECVRRGLPVIPVLLPGASAQPVLPLFLTQYTWVDLRGGITEEGLDRLEWGITGVKPKKRPASG